MMRTYRFAAKLSPAAHRRLDAFLREQKELWNAGLEERISAYQKTGKTITCYDQFKSLTELRRDCPEHGQYSAHAQRSALQRLDKAFQSFFRRVKAGEKPGFPRFKSINRMRSFDTAQFSLHRGGGFHSVNIKGVGKFRFKGELPDLGKDKYKTFRVVKTAKRVWVQVACELPELKVVDKRPALGLDLGVEALYALSNGEIAPGLRRDTGAIKRFQRKLSRAKGAKKGEKRSNNYKKIRLSLGKAFQAEKERTHGQLHETSRRLIKKHSARWFVEDLDIKAMTRKGKSAKRGLNRSIREQSWGKFINLLAYKAESAGGWVKKVNPAYTSKTCNHCGGVNHHLGRRDHMDCAHCNHQAHRDVNAAKNMLLGDWVSLAGGASRHARSRVASAARGARSRAALAASA